MRGSRLRCLSPDRRLPHRLAQTRAARHSDLPSNGRSPGSSLAPGDRLIHARNGKPGPDLSPAAAAVADSAPAAQVSPSAVIPPRSLWPPDEDTPSPATPDRSPTLLAAAPRRGSPVGVDA